MVAAIETLREKGYTYVSEGSTYYRISNFDGYGKLSHNDFSGIRAGARVDVDEYDKADARDFVLWKTKKEGEPSWNEPIGDGRPGWHIECSVMAMKYLGETLDIHAGGVDLIFPHHENEIAQSEAISGKPFARYWLHSEHLNVDMQKMSKSVGNIYTLRDTLEGLTAAATTIDRLRHFKLRLETDKYPEQGDPEIAVRIQKARQQFDESLDDDLNTAEALGAIFEFVRDANTAMDAGNFGAGDAPAALELLARFDCIFDVLRPSVKDDSIADAEVEKLIAERNQAKKARNFARADEIRKQLLDGGVIIEDTKDGVRWKRK